MGDSIYAKLYYNETEVTSHGCEDGKEYSVEKNLLNLLEKYKDNAALVAFINDTLAYGKAASEYKKHDTMTGDYAVSDSTIPDATVTPNGAFTGYTVVFGQVNFIKVSVELADGYTLYLDGTDITSQLVGGIFKTDGIAPTEFDKKFSFEIKNGDTVVQTFAVSVNDYIGAQKNSATMGNLIKALYNYGLSAHIYAGVHHFDSGTYIINDDGLTHTNTCLKCDCIVTEKHIIGENNACACGAIIIDGTLGGKTEATEEEVNALMDQLKAYVDSGNTTIIVTGSKPAMIDMGSYSATAIGEAIYRLSGSNVYDENNPYNGKIDLILSDVTEIVDWEFYAAFALNSITLPKVTTIGDQAFQGCDYLKRITFGSIVTSIVQENGVTFVVGDKVGGCDLVLNCGQVEAEDTYKPDLENNVWFKPSWGGNVTWKSITLTHTGECDECTVTE